jgi:hypothetical protein
MGSNRNAGAVPPPKSPIVREAQSLPDRQFEEYLRIADRLVQDLREAGYSCELAEYVRAGGVHDQKLNS